MWKETEVFYFKLKSHQLPRGTGENHERTSAISVGLWAQIPKLAPLELEAGKLRQS
jgi:hypothetical protein